MQKRECCEKGSERVKIFILEIIKKIDLEKIKAFTSDIVKKLNVDNIKEFTANTVKEVQVEKIIVSVKYTKP